MANRMGLLVISFVLFSRGIRPTAGKECKFEHKYVCGLQDCNCRYVSENGVSVSSFYERFVAMFSIPSNKGQVCDKCDVFCSEEKHINCYHGACDKQKGCICRDCWIGETCTKYDNRQPEFKQSLYVAEIKEDTNVNDEIVKVFAFDYDLEKCVDKQNCPCGHIKYSIKKGNEDGLFYINPDTGVISLTRNLYDQYDPISLIILAKNEGDLNMVEDNQNDKAMATVVISTVQNFNVRERRSLHHRTRRSVTFDALVSTFEAETNETFFDANSQIHYRLYLTQNQSASPHNLSSIRIQLTSENLQLGHGYLVNISNVIQNIDYNNFGNTVQFEILGSQMNATDYMEIKFNASVPATSHPLALLQVAFTMNATASGPVTYGPKYSPELYTTYPLITFARTTEGVVKAETILDYNVNVTLPNFNFTLMLVITTILNDFRFLNIENVQVGNISNSVQANNSNPTPMKYTRAGDNITSRVVLDFGYIKISNKDQNANTIKFSFSVKVNDHHMLENASIHWIGVGSHAGSDMLSVTQDFIQISKNEPFLFAEIEALNSTDPLVKEYFINDEVQFLWKVQHGNGSYETAENVTVEFYFPTSVVNLVSSAIWHENGSIKNETNGSEGSVLTFTPAGKNLSIGNTLSGILVVKVSENVTPFDDLNVAIKIRYQTSKGEARPIRTYKPDPGYLAGIPSFSVLANSSIVNIGQPIEVTLHITVKRMTLYGNLFVYLPQRNNSAIMRFIKSESFTIKNYGKNIEDSNFLNATPTYSSTTEDTTYYDRAEFNLGFIKNVDNSNVDNVENTMTLTFKIVLEDNDYVEDRANYSVSIGMKSSEKAVWFGQLTFTANVSLNRRPRLQIIALSNGTDSLVQGSVVEYSFTIFHKETSDAHAMDVEVIWMLPVYTKFIKVNNDSHQLASNKTKLNNNVIFTLSKLDFGEKPFVSFSVAMDPNKVRTKPGKNYAATPVALTYKNKQTYFEPLIPMVVSFTVPDSTVPPTTDKPGHHVPAPEFYHRGFLVDNSSSTVYMCAVSSKRDKPSCFWTTSNGKTWQAVHVSVINIIGIDTNKNIYGIGNDKRAYMKYVEAAEGKWHSILPNVWKKANEALPRNKVVIIEPEYDHESDPEIKKQLDIGNGEKWGANKLGVFHLPSSNGQWTRKACWDCLC